MSKTSEDATKYKTILLRKEIMISAYLVTRYSIEEKKFTSCEIWSVAPWNGSRTQPGELWSVIYEVRHNSFQEAIDSICFLIASGNYPKQWNEVLHLMSERDRIWVEEYAEEMKVGNYEQTN